MIVMRRSNALIVAIVLVMIAIVFGAVYMMKVRTPEDVTKSVKQFRENTYKFLNANSIKSMYFFYQQKPSDSALYDLMKEQGIPVKMIRLGSRVTEPEIYVFYQPIYTSEKTNVFLFKSENLNYEESVDPEYITVKYADSYYFDKNGLILTKNYYGYNDYIELDRNTPPLPYANYVCIEYEGGSVNVKNYVSGSENTNVVYDNNGMKCWSLNWLDSNIAFRIYPTELGLQHILVKSIKFVKEPIGWNLAKIPFDIQGLLFFSPDGNMKGINTEGERSGFYSYQTDNYIVGEANKEFITYASKYSNLKITTSIPTSSLPTASSLTASVKVNGNTYYGSYDGDAGDYATIKFNINEIGKLTVEPSTSFFYYAIIPKVKKKYDIEGSETYKGYESELSEASYGRLCLAYDPNDDQRVIDTINYIKSKNPAIPIVSDLNKEVCDKVIWIVDSKPKFTAEQILKYISEGGELFIFSMPTSDLNAVFGSEDVVAVLPVRKVYETGKRGSFEYLDFFIPSVDYDVLLPSTQSKCVASIMTDCVGWEGDSIYFFSVDPFDVRQYILDIASRAEKKTIYTLFYRDSFKLNQELYAKPGHFINDREPIRVDNQYYMWLKTNMQKLTTLTVGGSNNVLQYYTIKTQGALPIVETSSSVVNEFGALRIKEMLEPLSMKTIEAKVNIKVYDDAKTDNVRVSLIIPFNPSSIKWITPSGIQAGAFGNMIYPTAILESGNSKVLISVIHDDAFVSKTITHNYYFCLRVGI